MPQGIKMKIGKHTFSFINAAKTIRCILYRKEVHLILKYTYKSTILIVFNYDKHQYTFTTIEHMFYSDQLYKFISFLGPCLHHCLKRMYRISTI